MKNVVVTTAADYKFVRFSDVHLTANFEFNTENARFEIQIDRYKDVAAYGYSIIVLEPNGRFSVYETDAYLPRGTFKQVLKGINKVLVKYQTRELI